MIYYITFLRFLAACFITNAHYVGIYPSDLIANGGLLGDVLFFAVSGFCLYNIKGTFVQWLWKRFVRIFPAVWIITALYWLLGYYDVQTNVKNIFWWFGYPTYYHFVGSYIALLVPFYCVVKCPWKDSWKVDKFVLAALITGVAYFVVYFLFYDKTYYHIDVVREPMIRFLYFESMLLGAIFRRKDEFFRSRTPKLRLVLPLWIVTTVAYFASKLLFVKDVIPGQYQVLNQIALFCVLLLFLLLFASLDRRLNDVKTGKNGARLLFDKVVPFVASLTLEIYLVQYVLIDLVRSMKLAFPINWLLLSSAILVAAFCLHSINERISKILLFPSQTGNKTK